jgi:2-polyprenyl-6-methoxyphenol hydroxylase-like FAD-dependent oxidoreductase
MHDTDTLIIGGGPTGLTLAIGLLLKGHQVMVVDERAAQATTSRAAVVHAFTLEQLAPYGVAKRLVELGLQAPTFSIRDRDRVLVPVPFGDLPTAYPYSLMISQAVTESVLLARLAELGGEVLRPRRLITVDQDSDGVTAVLESADGDHDRFEIRTRYLVGADGMHSTVRQQVGIGFSGGSYAESFTLADVRLDGGGPADEVILYFSPAGMVVLAPLPDGNHRIVATVDQAPEHPDVAFVQGLLDTRGPEAERAVVRQLIWGSRFHLHHRVADSYRAGRVLLAGDAAHVHSPAGGQGMNAGITDAVALAGYLAEVLSGGPDSPLDDYTEQRRPVAENVVGLADRLTRLATARHRRLRNVVLGLLGRLPMLQRRIAWQLSGLAYRKEPVAPNHADDLQQPFSTRS